MAGLTSEGLEIKRLNQVIEDREASARNYFGSDVGTSVNDVIGRLLRVAAAAEADEWEVLEAVYNSFNPAFATGKALDRIVAYAGLTRYEAEPSTAMLLVSGDYLSTVPFNSEISSSVTSYKFITTATVFFDTALVSGFSFEPITVAEENYTVTIGAEAYSYTSVAGDTLESVAQALHDQINLSQGFSATIDDSVVTVTFNDVFVARDTNATSNLTYRKISKIVNSEADRVGPISQPANTLDTLSTPVLGWDSVTNPTPASEGRLSETDEELRLRFRDTKELNARGTIDALYSNLSEIQGVTDINVYENSTSFADIDGLPAKSFSAVIRGGNSLEIAQTIWTTKPAGIEAFGNTAVAITDSQGLPHTIHFSRPEFVDVYMRIEISPSENGIIAADTDVKIIDALVDYFEENYSVGDDVIYSRLYTPINSISGYQVDSLQIGTSFETLAMTNVVVGFDKVADVKRQNVQVIINN